MPIRVQWLIDQQIRAVSTLPIIIGLARDSTDHGGGKRRSGIGTALVQHVIAKARPIA
jgi:hypothetical protein